MRGEGFFTLGDLNGGGARAVGLYSTNKPTCSSILSVEN